MTTHDEYMAQLQEWREIEVQIYGLDKTNDDLGLEELVNGGKQPPDDYAPDSENELEFRGRKKYIPDDFENHTPIKSIEEFWGAKAQKNLWLLVKKFSASTPNKITALIHSDDFKKRTRSFRRMALCAASFALSDKGIAPYWQQLRIACEPGDDSPDSDIGRLMLKTSDSQLYDMYWLSSRIKRAKISSTYFNRLRYGDRFNMDNAIEFASRAISAQKKIRMLGISAEMEIGCLVLYSSETSKLREAAKRKAGLARWGLVKNKNARNEQEIEADRRLFAECAHLGGYKPTATANILSWRSGEQKDHRYVSVKLKRIKLQKSPSSE